jgi:hypothetical protein
MTDHSNFIARPRWSYLRLSLRGLIVLVIVIGAEMGWLVRSARIHCEAVAAIEQTTTAPPEPRLLEPVEGQSVSVDKPYSSWTVASGGGPFLAQVFEYHFGDMDDKDLELGSM